MMRRTSTRAALAGILSVPLLAVGGLGASADDDQLTVDNLPMMTDNEMAQFIEPIEIPDIEPVDVPEIEPFEPEVTSSGGDTVVSLNTDVLFEFGKAELGGSAKQAVVDAVADVPNGAKVAVVGHTDAVGSDADNKTLSKERAQAVADVIEKERKDLELTVSGKGEADPVEPNSSGGEDNPDGREKNRRVEIRYAE